DSKWIGFCKGAKLYKISTEGGTALPLADLGCSQNGGGVWGDDGTVLLGGAFGLVKIAPGGQPGPLTQTQGPAHLGPQILPDGHAGLFAEISGERAVTTSIIEAVRLADGKRKEIVHGISPHYLPTGHLVYMSNGALLAIAFDPDKL